MKFGDLVFGLLLTNPLLIDDEWCRNQITLYRAQDFFYHSKEGTEERQWDHFNSPANRREKEKVRTCCSYLGTERGGQKFQDQVGNSEERPLILHRFKKLWPMHIGEDMHSFRTTRDYPQLQNRNLPKMQEQNQIYITKFLTKAPLGRKPEGQQPVQIFFKNIPMCKPHFRFSPKTKAFSC